MEPSVPRRQTTVYVDGFNLFYGALKGQKHYWLDLLKFSEGLLQRENVIALEGKPVPVERSYP